VVDIAFGFEDGFLVNKQSVGIATVRADERVHAWVFGTRDHGHEKEGFRGHG
jgi:hypothetical protein